MMAAMIAHPDAARHDLSRLRLCTSAGEALPRELYDRWQATSASRCSTGSAPPRPTTSTSRTARPRSPGSVGEVVPGYRARVLDDEGGSCPTARWGPLDRGRHRRALLLERAREEQAHVPRRLREHGRPLRPRPRRVLRYRGRSDELIKVGGIWVAPSEVEHCLISHPDVVECAVVGYEDGGLTLTRAHVVLRRGRLLRRAGRGAAGARARTPLPAQVPARRPLRGRAAEDAVGQDRPGRRCGPTWRRRMTRVVVVTGGGRGSGRRSSASRPPATGSSQSGATSGRWRRPRRRRPPSAT